MIEKRTKLLVTLLCIITLSGCASSTVTQNEVQGISYGITKGQKHKVERPPVAIDQEYTAFKKYSLVSSWYQSGRKTANGERFNPNGFTVASRTLPFNTFVRLTNPNTGKIVIARVNDRGPYAYNFNRATLDVTRRVAWELGFIQDGLAHLTIEVLDKKANPS